MTVTLDERWDAGETGCGARIFERKTRLEAVPPGGLLDVMIRDAGAPTDLPVRCRMTGQSPVSADPPV